LSVNLFWFLVFLFAGLYRSWYRTSFFDEVVLVMKSVTFGAVGLLLLSSIEIIRMHPITPTKLIVLVYVLILLILVVIGRIGVRAFQKKLLLNGIGRRKALIIGWNHQAHNLCKQLKLSPHFGYDAVGFIKVSEEVPIHDKGLNNTDNSKYDIRDFMYLDTYRKIQQELQSIEKASLSNEFCEDKDILGSISDLEKIIREQRISEVLIALDPSEHKTLLEIITVCDQVRETVDHPLNIKIIPDLYTIISGQARTTQVEGIPLIELEPEIMPVWEQNVKRLLDITVSFFVLILLTPLWIILAVAVKATSKGPVFFHQERAGRHGKPFLIHKFRSMAADAEAGTGPALATHDDPRVTRIGKFLRKTRLDEFPQFYNVLKGDMSIVGPRPERAFYIQQIVKQAPQYIHLSRVRPGISSLGQVKYGYAGNVDEMIERMKFDILYIENMSLRMDFKIIFYTIYVMLMGRGR
jgi:lipopolysaccharide/colanic/teichoic acid biosynthesis glycosyltransferase